jgi:hypothetical protein
MMVLIFMEDPQQQAVRNTMIIPAPVVVQNIATTKFFPTSIPGIYYNIYIANSINATYTAYIPSNTSWTREIDNAAEGGFPVGLYIEVWRGVVSSIGNGEAHPVINGEVGRFKAGMKM